MTPVPLHLPLRLPDAAELASLIFEHAERKPLTDELRNRLAARAAVLRLETVSPCFGSLARDPVHPSTYYLAADNAEGAPYLLHLALASAPTSSIFHKPLLIGRTRHPNGSEFVINAIPFGPADRDSIERFAARVDPSVLPRAQGARASVTVRGDYFRAFEFFRSLQKRRNRNLAAVAGDYHACLWAAIRAGFRQEYSLAAEFPADRAGEAPRQTLAYTRFAIDVSSLPAGDDALKAAAHAHEQIRQARALLKSSSAFEFEVVMGPVSAAEFAAALESLKQCGHPPQFARTASAADPAALAEAARAHKVTLSFDYAGESAAVVEARARAAAGRLNYYAATAAEAEILTEWILA